MNQKIKDRGAPGTTERGLCRSGVKPAAECSRSPRARSFDPQGVNDERSAETRGGVKEVAGRAKIRINSGIGRRDFS